MPKRYYKKSKIDNGDVEDDEIQYGAANSEENVGSSSEDNYSDSDADANADSESESDIDVDPDVDDDIDMDEDEDENEDNLDNEDDGSVEYSSSDNDSDYSNLSDSDSDNERNEVNTTDCVYDYIGTDLEELETEKIKQYDLNAVDFFDEPNISTNKENYLVGDNRVTKPFMTKYEKIEILSVRTKQLSNGAKSMIKNSIDMDPYEVAKLELKYNVIPLLIERPLPNNFVELWKVSELTHY